MLYPALLPLMRTPRLLVADWTDAPADLNGLVRFSKDEIWFPRVCHHISNSVYQPEIRIQKLNKTVKAFTFDGRPVQIRTENIPNKSQNCYCYIRWLACRLVSVSPRAHCRLRAMLWADAQMESNSWACDFNVTTDLLLQDLAGLPLLYVTRLPSRWVSHVA